MSFEVSRLRRSDRVIGIGAIALFVFMFFFKWFGGSFSSSSPLGGAFNASVSVNAWHSLSNTRWLLLLTVIVALGVVALVALGRELDSPVSPSAIVLGLGGLSAILVFYRILDHPHGGVSIGSSSFSYGAKIGLYLGFLACLAVAYGGFLAMNEEGTSLTDVREQARASFDSVTSSASGTHEAEHPAAAAPAAAQPGAEAGDGETVMPPPPAPQP